jgi:serine protease Do/serine protease DegQ
VEINGKAIHDATDVRNYVGLLRIGQKVNMVVLREGKRKTLNAVVEEPEMAQTTGKTMHPRLEGAQFGDITEGTPLFGRIEGVLVTEVEPGSPAWRAGLRKGDVIISANRKQIKSLAELASIIKGSNTLLLNIQRGNLALFLYLQ